MQTRNQWKRPRDWKVVAGVAAAATLGITGLALASPDDGSVPDAITLEDQASVVDVSIPDSLPPVSVVDLTDDTDLDSPFDDSPIQDSPDDSPPGPTTTLADDSPSPDDSPPAPSTTAATVADDSPSPDDSPAAPTTPITVADDSPSPDDSPPAPPSGGGDDSDDSGSDDS